MNGIQKEKPAPTQLFPDPRHFIRRLERKALGLIGEAFWFIDFAARVTGESIVGENHSYQSVFVELLPLPRHGDIPRSPA